MHNAALSPLLRGSIMYQMNREGIGIGWVVQTPYPVTAVRKLRLLSVTGAQRKPWEGCCSTRFFGGLP